MDYGKLLAFNMSEPDGMPGRKEIRRGDRPVAIETINVFKHHDAPYFLLDSNPGECKYPLIPGSLFYST